MTIIYEDYESNINGRPINNKGRLIKTNSKGQIIFKSNGKPALNNNNNPLPIRIPQDSSKNIKKHEKTMYSYRILKIENKNGSMIEKYVKVNKDGKNMKDGENYIYLHKQTGEPISANGKKYLVNTYTGELARRSKEGERKLGNYVLNNNNNIVLKKKLSNPSSYPSLGMMRVVPVSPLGGFVQNRKKNANIYKPEIVNTSKGSFFNYTGNIPKSNQVPTRFGPVITQPKRPGLKI